MLNHRAVARAVRTLKVTAEFLRKHASNSASEVEDAVNLLKIVSDNYFLIPRDIREEYFEKEGKPDGLQLQDLPEGRM